jgi:hypothetical protein
MIVHRPTGGVPIGKGRRDMSERQLRVRPDSPRQAAVAVITLGAILALGLFATDQFVVAKRSAPADGTAPSEVYTGSILYTPDEGQTCHQILFDNHTGKFTDNGTVDCERAAYHGVGATPEGASTSRLSAIAGSFRRH